LTVTAFSFDPRFIAAIQSGQKRQTIRPPRRYRPRLGGQLQLYTGLRTKLAGRIGTATCIGAREIRIDFDYGYVDVKEGPVGLEGETHGFTLHFARILDIFARADGFDDWQAFRDFFTARYPANATFEGHLYEWTGFVPSARPG
jgi:hypothetical protein